MGAGWHPQLGEAPLRQAGELVEQLVGIMRLAAEVLPLLPRLPAGMARAPAADVGRALLSPTRLDWRTLWPLQLDWPPAGFRAAPWTWQLLGVPPAAAFGRSDAGAAATP